MLYDANSHGDQTQGGDNVFLLDVPDDSSQDVASVTSSVKRLSFSMYYDEANSNPHDMDVFFEDVPVKGQLCCPHFLPYFSPHLLSTLLSLI